MALHQMGLTGSTAVPGTQQQQQQQQQSTTTSTSSSVSPSARQLQHHIQQRHSQQQHRYPRYNLLAPPPPPPPPLSHASYSPTITLPSISTNTISINTHSQYLHRNDEEIGPSSSWPRPGDLQHQHPVYQSQQSNKKRETMNKHLDAGASMGRNADDMPCASDFVKKLYKMLEDPSFLNVVSWGPMGDCFVVKDMNEFTTSILPRMFKHSNFASFVRQLNKYDFHKVKNTDDNMFGEQSWTFRHPDFQADRKDALENIKRKVPAQRKTSNVPNSTTTSMSGNKNSHHYHHHSSSSPSMHHDPHSHSHHTTTSSSYRKRSQSPSQSQFYTSTLNPFDEINELKSRLLNLESSFDSRLRSLELGYEGRMRGLEKNYESLLVQLVAFQSGVAQRDGVVKSLIRCHLGEDNEHKMLLTTTMDHNLATMTTAGLSLPSTMGSACMEERLEQYSRQSQNQNLPFSQTPPQPPASPHSQAQPQSQSQPVSETPSPSNRSLFLPQDTVQRILGATTTTTQDGVDRSGSQSQGQNQGRHQEGRAQIMEYHRESLAKSMERKNGADGGGDERVVDQGRDGDVRGKRKRRDSDAELGLERHGGGKAYTFRQSTGPATSTTISSAVPWSSSSTTNNNNNSLAFRQDEGDSPSSSPLMTNVNEEFQVYTVGHLIPRNTPIDEKLENWNFDTTGFSSAGTSANANTSSKDLGNNLTYEPGAVPSQDVRSLGREDGDDDEDVEIIPPPGILTTGSSTATTSTSTPLASSSSLSSPTSSSSQQKLLVRQATLVPGVWAVSPRVLLVDDDAVIRKLSSKFLKIFGCTTDVAVDGIGAVTKMNLEKYDLVLMDILMPKLDGISATNLIRKFDRGTPIISMTANSKPNEIIEYYSSGMNDILPKPFTKEGLLDILEKHLMHLKVMQQMTVIPRSVGVPSLSDANFEQVLMTNAMMVHQQQQQRQSATAVAGLLVSRNTGDATSPNTLSSPISLPHQQQPQQLVSHQQHPSQISFTSLLAMGEDDERINNPLAGMGLSDEHYNMILQNLVNGERFMGMWMDGVVGGGGEGGNAGGVGGVKRPIDDVGDGSDERGGKRGRFEVVE